MPPWRSASVTTPTGSDTQLLHHRLRRPAPRRLRLGEQDELGRAAADVEQDDAARLRVDQRRAAGGGEIGLGLAVDDLELDADPVADDREELGPFSAARQASVAISRARVTDRLRILSRHTVSADTARSIAASDSRPVAETPSPSRMMRENASMTRKPSPDGRAISRRQLLVPRSRAA